MTWRATDAQAERALKMLKRVLVGVENGNQAAENVAVIAYAFGRLTAEELEDELSEIISDSIDMDWSPRDGAKAIIRKMVLSIQPDITSINLDVMPSYPTTPA